MLKWTTAAVVSVSIASLPDGNTSKVARVGAGNVGSLQGTVTYRVASARQWPSAPAQAVSINTGDANALYQLHRLGYHCIVLRANLVAQASIVVGMCRLLT